MAHTHLCLLYHIIFSTKARKPWLTAETTDRLYPYIVGVLRNLGGCPIIVNGGIEHVHILCQLRGSSSIAKVVQGIKSNSSSWFRKTFRRSTFAWQEGYGAFTVSVSQKDRVYRYIADQKEHHRSKSFQEEYLEFLKSHGVEYDERFVWG